MNPDVNRLIGFYKSPLGKIARALVREEVIRLAGNVERRRILGLGFASPYLRFSLEKAERVLVFMSVSWVLPRCVVVGCRGEGVRALVAPISADGSSAASSGA